MAQSTILTAAKTVRASSAIVIAAGEIANFAIFTDATTGVPPNEGAAVYLDTPSQDQLLATMSRENPTASVQGPAEVIIKTQVTTVNIGVVRYT